ncbi:PLAC8-like protein 1 isoform X2 [Paroedura picta]|uniref:PLAC8-like protein 1 isoform X2 n=1 Tax=Paroedura picta TaxID=143630 RepID=UPI0040562DD0
MDKLRSCCLSTAEKNSQTIPVQLPLVLPLLSPEEWPVFLSLLSSSENLRASPGFPVPHWSKKCPRRTQGAESTYCESRENSAAPVMTQPAPGGVPLCSSIPAMVHPGGVCGLLCSLCLECSVASRYGECFCFPLLWGSTLAVRVGTRERYKIHGTLCEDWMAVHCCWPFAVCQVAREMKRRPSLRVYEINQSSPPPPPSQRCSSLKTKQNKNLPYGKFLRS